jgi:hypothetical protein
MSIITACLEEQRRARPECNWIAARDYCGSGRVVIVPELPAETPAIYDAWPWSAIAGYRRTRRELRALGFTQAEAR